MSLETGAFKVARGLVMMRLMRVLMFLVLIQTQGKHQFTVVQMMDRVIYRLNNLLEVLEKPITLYTIHWIEIYPVNNITHLLNNLGHDWRENKTYWFPK